ncbi:hypothetical protein [Pedobacter nutrimenti]|uniref:Addiction module component n=1 Tax=Pedobacter nutrimenti TaxID=1241337 RepID=A0A318UJJ9_9SPHI|nr:hypothetical protein [Pedobacter nutrimenti]PYF76554.1 hypothetical protein B0O44_10125 [Pedobacter nutrimenti]
MIAVELSFRQLMDAVRQLSPAEKLELNEVIWSDDVSIPLEHQNLVHDRIKSSTVNSDLLLDWEAASKKLKA